MPRLRPAPPRGAPVVARRVERPARTVRRRASPILPCLSLALLVLLAVPTVLPAVAQEPTEPDSDPGVGLPPDPAPWTDPTRREAGDEPRPDEAIPAPPEPGVPAADERSVVLVERVCETSLDRREVTLFANGTVRVRQIPQDGAGGTRRGSFGGPEMALGELPPDDLEAWVDSVRGEPLGESDRHSAGPVGDLVASCRLLLDYDAMARWVGVPPPARGDRTDWRPAGRLEVEYGAFDSLGLSFARVLERVDDLAGRVDAAAGRRSLPARYAPAVGDVLRRADGLLFRVERSTASPGGWELQGVDQPLTLYVMQDRFASLFVELVRRR